MEVENAGGASMESNLGIENSSRSFRFLQEALMLVGGQPQMQLNARGELRRWAAIREYWGRAVDYLTLARAATDPGIQDRYLKVAQYYRAVAEAEERAAIQRADARLAG